MAPGSKGALCGAASAAATASADVLEMLPLLVKAMVVVVLFQGFHHGGGG